MMQPDWDPRVQDRIQNLKPEEIGYQKIISLKMNGVPQPFKMEETILEVNLTKPILPNTTVHFEMEFEARYPCRSAEAAGIILKPKCGIP